MAEFFDLRNRDGTKTGVVKERTLVHRDGDLHGTAHVWILRPNGEKFDLLMQKRSDCKDAYPGCWDTSSAGHLPAGSDFLESALRELEEELGLTAQPENLYFIGYRNRSDRAYFRGEPFLDNEYAAVYLLIRNVQRDELHLQEEEVADAQYFPIDWIFEHWDSPDFVHCLYQDELRIISAAYRTL